MNRSRTPRREETVRELKLNLRRFAMELLISSYEATDGTGLNSTDLGALCLLLLHGPTSAGRLAELTGVTTGAVTGVVDRLEDGGFVRREPHPTDRRKVIVAPVPARAERELFPHFSSLQRAASTKLYDDYTEAELESIAGFLSRLTSPAH